VTRQARAVLMRCFLRTGNPDQIQTDRIRESLSHFGITQPPGLAGRILYDIFPTRISSNDTCDWTYCFGGSEPDYSNGISVDAAGNLYFCGGFFSTNMNFAEEWGGDGTKSL
jgi:hypothetical protein